jgi:hypothetical protein
MSRHIEKGASHVTRLLRCLGCELIAIRSRRFAAPDAVAIIGTCLPDATRARPIKSPRPSIFTHDRARTHLAWIGADVDARAARKLHRGSRRHWLRRSRRRHDDRNEQHQGKQLENDSLHWLLLYWLFPPARYSPQSAASMKLCVVVFGKFY